MSKIYKAIGLMSGTSLDGVDVAVLETDGVNICKPGGHLFIPYSDDLKIRLKSVLNSANSTDHAKLEDELTILNAKAVVQLLIQEDLSTVDIDIIGYHGQTIDHRPDDGVTVQLGDGSLMVDLTGIDTVNDFRSNDITNNGQGAPLAPVYHRAIFAQHKQPVAVINIGGVSNITYINNGDIVAFDLGPGNALIDDWIAHHTEGHFDDSGAIASSGVIDKSAVELFMKDEFFFIKPPKSLDRNYFNKHTPQNLSLEDGAATLTEFTIQSIKYSLEHLPEKVSGVYITGGGRLNKYLMQRLNDVLKIQVQKIEDSGHDGDFIEAEAFAYLAVRSLKDLPLSFPTTTGVSEDVSGGRLHSFSKDKIVNNNA